MTFRKNEAHLFFYGKDVLFSQVRLLTGAAATAADPGATSDSPAPKDPGYATSNSPTTNNSAIASSSSGKTDPFANAGATSTGNSIGNAATTQDTWPTGFISLTSGATAGDFRCATGTFNVTPAGLKPYDKYASFKQRQKIFLSKDFIFEASVDVPEKLDRGQCIIGLGDATNKGSIRLMIRGDNRVQAFLSLGDEWGKHFGDLHELPARSSCDWNATTKRDHRISQAQKLTASSVPH